MLHQLECGIEPDVQDMRWIPGDWLADRVTVRVYRVLAGHSALLAGLCVLLTASLAVPTLLREARSDAELLFRGFDNSSVHQFKMDYSHELDLSRATKFLHFVRVVFRAKDGGDLFRPEVWSDVERLDDLVSHRVAVRRGDQEFRYDNLCLRNDQRCYRDDLFKVFTTPVRNAMLQGVGSVRYPFLIDVKNFKFHFLGQNLAQVGLDSRNNVLNASLAGLLYFIDGDDAIMKSWQHEVAASVLREQANSSLEVFTLTNVILEAEYHDTLMFVIELGALLITGALVFWGLLIRPSLSEALGLAIGMTFAGCAGLLGVGLTVVVIGWDFTLLQLGIVFVLVGSALVEWPILLKACQNDPETGLRRASSWLVSGSVGPAVLYATVGVVLPCPAAVLSALPWLLGSLFHLPLQLVALSLWRELAGPFPAVHSAPVAKKLESNHGVRVLVLVSVWLALGTVSVWSVSSLGTKVDAEYFYSPRSEALRSLKLEDEHFSSFLFRIHIAVDQPLDYSDPAVQRQIASLVDNNPLSNVPELNESWLKFYLIFLKDPRSWFLTRKYDTSSPQGFIDCLRDVFLGRVPQAKRFKQDIIFGGPNNSQIVASRFLIQLRDVRDTDSGQAIFNRVKEYGQSFPFKLSFYHVMSPTLELMENLQWKMLGLAAIIGAIWSGISITLTANCTLSSLLGLGLFGANLGIIASLKIWAIELNSPMALLILLYFGFSVKFCSNLLYCFQENQDSGAFLSALIAVAALGTGSIGPLLIKSYIFIADKIAILAFSNLLLQLLLFAAPFLLQPSIEKLNCLKSAPDRIKPTNV